MNDKIEAAQSTAIVEPTSETTLRNVLLIIDAHRTVVANDATIVLTLAFIRAIGSFWESDRARIEDLTAENVRLRGLCTKADGYLGLWLHRYWKSATPDDIMKGEVDRLIGQLRNAYEKRST